VGGTLRWDHSLGRQAKVLSILSMFPKPQAPSLRARHGYLTHRHHQNNLIINRFEACRWYQSLGALMLGIFPEERVGKTMGR
jgi:hypothetical protein